jgi:excisionase family DNA binding protein
VPTAKTPVKRRRPSRAGKVPPPAPPPERPNLSVPEAAAVIGCSEATVYNRLRDGTFKRVQIGGRTRLNRAAVEAYAAKGDPTPRNGTRSPGAGTHVAGQAQPLPRRPATSVR